MWDQGVGHVMKTLAVPRQHGAIPIKFGIIYIVFYMRLHVFSGIFGMYVLVGYAAKWKPQKNVPLPVVVSTGGLDISTINELGTSCDNSDTSGRRRTTPRVCPSSASVTRFLFTGKGGIITPKRGDISEINERAPD